MPDERPDEPGHEADDRAFGRINLIGRVLLAQIGRQPAADEHPETAAAVSGVDKGMPKHADERSPPQKRRLQLCSDISRISRYSRPRCVMSSSPRMIAQRVLQLHQLNEQVVLRIQPWRGHRALEIERQPLLNAAHPGALRQIQEQRHVEHDGRRQNAVAAEKVDLELHRIAQPSEQIDVVPTLFVVAAGRIVIDPDDVAKLLVEIRIEIRLEDVVEDRFLAFFLGLERLGVVEHLAVAIAEDVGRVPALDAEQPRLESRRDDGLHPRLPGLQVLAGDRRAALRGELQQRRNIGAEIRRRVGVRNAFLDGGVRVDHARGNRGVARLEALLERRHAGVHRALGEVHLGAAAPDHDQPFEAVLRLEPPHVFAQLVGHLPLVRALLHVGAVEALHVLAVEHGRHRTNLLELGADLVEQCRLENARRLGGLVGVVFEDVPAAKHHVVERGQRNEVLDERRTALGALAEPHRSHLRQRADRLGQTAADGEDAGDGRRADGAHPDEKNAQFPCRFCDFWRIFHDLELYHQVSRSLEVRDRAGRARA